LGFSPDLVWVKSRSFGSGHALFDVVRGALQYMGSELATAETSLSGTLTSFDSDGFSLGTNAGVNGNTRSYVGWAWDAGSGSAASNTDGTITSTVKANPDYGFSVTSFVGTGANATVGHGLSSAPDLVILKNRSIVSSWLVRSSDLAANQTLLLENTTTPIATDYWQNTQPDSSVFSVSSNSEANGSGNNLIAYCFSSVAGYSSIGTYTGNGSASGPTVTTGFRPAFVMAKRTDGAGNWVIYDNTRVGVNPVNKLLYANLTDVEATWGSGGVDFNDTGFQVKNSGGDMNVNGGTYLYITFADTREAAFWKDVSGQGNHWTPNNLDYRDSLPDSPANNFATLNPLDNYNTGATLSEGNLKWTIGAADGASRSTYVMTTGKWYVEFLSNNDYIGVVSGNANITNMNGTQTVYYAQDGTKRVNGSSTSYGASYTSGDIIGIALDLDASPQTVTFYKNNASQGALNLTDVDNEGYSVSCGSGSGSTNATANFGQDSTFAGAKTMGAFTDSNSIGNFQYAPPDGFLALCSVNLPTPSIIDGSEHFNTALYNGTGATQSITGVNHQPDLVWIKIRDTTSHHVLTDSVRGVSTQLFSSLTNVETTESGKGVTSFDSDGFTLGTELSVTGSSNNGSYTYAAWNWKAGGTAVSNTAGTITSQVSANTAAGFSIVSYTGSGANATVGHGLSSAPSMIIAKRRDTSENWPVYHTSTGSSQYAYLDHTQAFSVATSAWQGVDPTSSVFSIGTSLTVNSSGGTYIAYCFANTDTTKTGSYTGNGSADGPFIYTGFRPAWIMIKRTDGAGGWNIHDNTRNAYNPEDLLIRADTSSAETTGGATQHDFTSNGFKLRTTNTDMNASGGSYIYLAFAESPFKYSNAR
jgi:hypothetical protein